MEQKGKHRSSLGFAILAIAVGVILILSAVVGGITFIIALAKGLVGHTLSGVRILILDIVLEFCVPMIGGIILIVAALKIMKVDTIILDRKTVSSSRKKAVEQKERMINVFLNADEKKVVELIRGNPDGALQSDLVIKTGYSKVKVHRILKNLENKDIIKRGRFGITNRVLINKY